MVQGQATSRASITYLDERRGHSTQRYTGEPYDSATGLYYFGARYYDPTIGRFVTQDSYPGTP